MADVGRSRRALTLFQVAEVLGFKHERKAERRRAALRAVRKMERRQRATYLERRGKEFVVSVHALEHMLGDSDVSLTGLEKSVAELAEIQRNMRRQLNGQGARIKNLERWRTLTTRYLAACADEIEPESSQHRATGSD